jgi:uncharacterized protein (TIGR03792 family)
MVIEWLKIHVTPEQREYYIQKDAEIWTVALAKYPGFLGKEVWLNPDNMTEIILVIHWETIEQWQAIPAHELQEIEAQLAKAMGNAEHKIVESARYQVCEGFQYWGNSMPDLSRLGS